MTEKQSHDEQFARSAELGYETRDVSIGGVAWAGAALVILLAAALSAMYLLTNWLLGPAVAQQAERPAARSAEPFDAPQANQSLIRKRQEQVQQSQLESYGWLDREQGVARIPIARAIEMMAADPSLWDGEEPQPLSQDTNSSEKEKENNANNSN